MRKLALPPWPSIKNKIKLSDIGGLFFGDESNTFAEGNDMRFSNPRTPSGEAGGDLTGSYPNPTLILTGVTANSYGDSTHVPQITVDTKGRLTMVNTIAIDFPDDFIVSVNNTNSVGLTVSTGILTADIRKQNSSTINLSVDSSGLKADFVSMNLSQFSNDSGYAVYSTIIPYLVLSGTIQIWGSASIPSSWLLCDGSSVLRSDYPNLFSVIGITFGSVDGTHFTLPDFRGKFPFGKSTSGTGNTLGGSFGNIDHTHTADPPSTNSSSDGSHNHGGVTGAPSATQNNTALLNLTPVPNVTHTHTISTDGAHTHSVDIASFNTGSANPPALVINFIIKI